MINFNKIYNENHKMILNFIILKTNDIELSKEIANDVFMKIHNNIDRYDETLSSFKTWMYNITKNTVIDFYRKKKLETCSLDVNEFDIENHKILKERAIERNNAERIMIANETLRDFENVLNTSLSKSNIDVAKLYYLNQCSYSEIAEMLNIPIGTVKGKLFRIKELLNNKNIKVS